MHGQGRQDVGRQIGLTLNKDRADRYRTDEGFPLPVTQDYLLGLAGVTDDLLDNTQSAWGFVG